MGYRLSGLFYYDPSQKKHAGLKKGLEEYKFLLWATSAAIDSFEAGDFEKFDSLVGENACQIRAVKIALMGLKNGEFFKGLKQRVSGASEKVGGLLSSKDGMNSIMHKGYSLGDVLQQHELEIPLTADQMFIVQSYLLAEMKECQVGGEFITSILRKERCSPSMIRKKYPEISYSFLEKTAKKLRKLLSMASVEFVRKVASDLQDHQSLRMVASDFEVEHNTLSCIPTFWSFKALFSLAHREGLPLVMHVKFLDRMQHGFRVVDEEFIYFKLCEKTGAYVMMEPVEEELALPTCIIQGVVCPKEGQMVPSKEEWKEKIFGHSILDMVLAMGADHRQYPDSNREVDVRDDEYEQYRKFAKERGFALDNPTTFFVQHIYCSQPKNVISREALRVALRLHPTPVHWTSSLELFLRSNKASAIQLDLQHRKILSMGKGIRLFEQMRVSRD